MICVFTYDGKHLKAQSKVVLSSKMNGNSKELQHFVFGISNKRDSSGHFKGINFLWSFYRRTYS